MAYDLATVTNSGNQLLASVVPDKSSLVIDKIEVSGTQLASSTDLKSMTSISNVVQTLSANGYQKKDNSFIISTVLDNSSVKVDYKAWVFGIWAHKADGGSSVLMSVITSTDSPDTISKGAGTPIDYNYKFVTTFSNTNSLKIKMSSDTYATNDTVLHNSGDEAATGTKTFQKIKISNKKFPSLVQTDGQYVTLDGGNTEIVPADNSKVVHTTGDETIDGKKKFDTDPTDGAGNAYAKTVDVNQQLDKKVVDNKDGTEQLNGVKVQPFNKLSDTIGGRNLATSPGDVLVTPVDALGWSQTKIGTVTPEFFKIINRGTTQPITISFEINTPDDPTKTNLFDRIQIDGGAWGSDSVIGSDYFSVLGFKWHEMGNNVWKGTYSLQFAKGSYVIDSSRPKIILLQSAKNITPHNFTVLGNSLCLYWGTQVIDWTPAPEDKVNVTDMRKPASDVAGIEEVNAKQDKIGYTPADDSKVVHNTGTEEIAGQKTFDIAPIDKTTGNPYITKDGVPSLPSDIARTGQANTFSSLQTFSQGVKTLQTGSYSDANSLVNEGLYYNTNSSIKNGARSITTGYIQVMSGYGKMVRQIMYSDTDGGLIYDRTSQDGGSSWSNWTQIVTWSQVPSNFALTNQSQTFRAAQTFSIAPTITDASRDKGDNQAATMADLKSVENSAWRVANTYEASKYLFNPQVIYRVDSENKKIYLYGGGMAGRSSDTNQFKFLDFSDISKNISIDPSTRFTFANNDSPTIQIINGVVYLAFPQDQDIINYKPLLDIRGDMDNDIPSHAWGTLNYS